MTYQTYLGFDREDLLATLQHQLRPKRLRHSLGVEETAIRLAKRHGADPEKAGLAGLLHDYAKHLPDADFLDLIDRYELDASLKDWGNNIWHGLLGIYKIQEDLGVKDAEVLRAIEVHTTGAARMTDLDKILYVADYIEPGRSFPGVEEARVLAEQSLDRAVAYETAHTMAHLIRQAQPIFPQTLETYNAFCHYLRED